jgi:protein-S-isoprenylcysteine O-methyltransferase Ste14
MWYVTELLKIYKEPTVSSHHVAVGRTRFLGIILCSIAPLLLAFVAQPRIKGMLGIASTAIGIALMGIGIYLWIIILWLQAQDIMPALGDYHQTESSHLITTGIYAKVRNPIYTACFFTILGWYLIWRAVHGLLLMPVILIVILIGIFIEERYLTKKFSDEHKEYKRRVPMLFPHSLVFRK